MRHWMARGFVITVVAALGFVGAGAAWAAEVNGIWADASTKDLGEWAGVPWLKTIKIRGWLESYFVHNMNDPARRVVNANQGSSVVKATNTTIEGRTFDIHDDAPRMSLAEIELEKIPTRGEWGGAGFKLDLNGGDTPEIIYSTIQGATGKGVLNHADKAIQHATVGWMSPIGKGLRFDLGKFCTHIGAETIEGIKNNNLSHGLLYTYAIPFQDAGLRVNYPWSDKFYTELYVTRGWNVITGDNNRGKTIGTSFGWTPTAWFNLFVNHFFGPEQRNDDKNMRHLFDFQVALNNPIPKLNLLGFGDVGYEENALNAGTKNAHWHGLGLVARYQVTDRVEPALRLEYLHDRDGFATGVGQNLYEMTATLNYHMPLKKGFSVLIRPEYRFDKTSERFFSSHSTFQAKTTQHTIGAGAYVYF